MHTTCADQRCLALLGCGDGEGGIAHGRLGARSRNALQVRRHYPVEPQRTRKLKSLPVADSLTRARELQGLKRHIEAYLVAILEAVDHGARDAVHANGSSINLVDLDPLVSLSSNLSG